MTVGFSYVLLHSMYFDVVFVKVYEENSALHKYIVGKGTSTLITSADNYGYSFFNTIQKLCKWWFLKG